MRVAIYTRLSKASDESTSIDRQEESCRRTAEARWPEADIELLSDVDISGFQDVARPAFTQLLEQVSQYDGLVVYRIDRLTRRGARHLLELWEDVLQPAGCDLVSATEPIDTSGPFGELFLVLLGTFAKMESERMSDRLTASADHLRRAGWWVGGKPPVGYRPRRVQSDDGEHTILEPDPEVAAQVREGARRFVAGEPVQRLIEEGLAGIETLNGWRSVLANPVLAGYQTRGRYSSGGWVGWDIVFGPDGEPLQPWEPILDPTLRAQVLEIIDGRRRGMRQGRSLLGGLLECGRCGKTLTGDAGSRRYPRYRCSNGCGMTIAGTKTEQYLLGRTAAVLPAIVEQGLQAAQPDTSGELDRLEQVRQHLDRHLDRLLFEQGSAPDDPEVGRVEQRISACHAQIREAREAARITSPGSSVRGVLGDGNLAESLLAASEESQRRVMELVLGRVVILPPSRNTGNRFDFDRITLPDLDAQGQDDRSAG